MLLKVLVLFGALMGLGAVLTWAERRGSAMIQDRIGPTVRPSGAGSSWAWCRWWRTA